MKKIFLLLTLFLLACTAPAPAPTPTPVATVPTPTETIPAPSALPAPDYSMDAATAKKLDEGLTGTTKYFLTENFMKLGVGEHHTFGLGYTNRLAQKDNFLVTIAFKQAYDKSTNSLEVSASDVAGWLSHNDFSITPLNNEQQKKEPVVIEVQNLADGTRPTPGTYEFELRVSNQAGDFQVNTEYAVFTIAIQVV